jgi:uncharacterized protein with GYD domain
MAKYLIEFSYTGQGVQGLLKDGGSKRREAVSQLAKSLGGSLEAFYYTFGDRDGIAIIDGLDDVGISAASLVVTSSGAATTKTTRLISAEEIDQATKKGADYRPPGK